MRLIAIIILCLISSPCNAAWNAWLDNTLTKYRQDGEDGTSGAQSLTVQLAKNEIESLQVMIYADGEALSNVDVEVSALTKGSDAITDIYIYKQHYLDMRSIDVKGSTGDWSEYTTNVWRKNIGSVSKVWSGTPSTYHDQDVGFYYGGTAASNWHDGNNETVLDAAYKWNYDGTYLYVYCTSNPASYFSEIHAPNRKSRIEYSSGIYPDALLPKVDRYYGEARNTFPFNVASGKVQGVWIDIGTTASTVAGSYSGNITISADGKTDIVLPITIDVWNFSLPSSTTFKGNFVMSFASATFGHGYGYAAASPPTGDVLALAKIYAKAFQYHKMAPVLSGTVPGYGSSYLTWDSGTKTLSIPTWEPWYSIVDDIYSGTAINSGPYAGAKSWMRPPYHWPTELDSNIAAADKETAARQYFQLVFDKMAAEGWTPAEKLIMSAYHDEPKCDQTTTWRGATWNKCEAIIDQFQDLSSINTGGAGTFKRSYVNTKLTTGLEDVEDYGFHSTNNYSYVCPGWDRTCTGGGTAVPRSSYTADDVFGYLACDNNGCWLTGSSFTSGQIDWSADAPAVYNRFPGLIWAKYDLTGTIYWQTTGQDYYESNVAGAGRPYDSIWNFGSNGDGHLVYPGVATDSGRTMPTATTPIIGGTHDIPVESIRMKHIRDAIEDWEYARMAASKRGEVTMEAAVDDAFSDADYYDAYWHLNTTPSNFLNVRAALAAMCMGTRYAVRVSTGD